MEAAGVTNDDGPVCSECVDEEGNQPRNLRSDLPLFQAGIGRSRMTLGLPRALDLWAVWIRQAWSKSQRGWAGSTPSA